MACKYCKGTFEQKAEINDYLRIHFQLNRQDMAIKVGVSDAEEPHLIGKVFTVPMCYCPVCGEKVE